ncbi:MAG: transcription-repair coupling factor [Armatimonadota bacterium]|nr:MAG: transcription-repair coupling factor [Armatimonadota bacterium]
MSWLVSALDGWAEMQKIEEGLASAGASRVRVDGATDPAKALVAAGVARAFRVPVLLISPTSESAQRIYDHLLALADGLAPPSEENGPNGRCAVLLPSLEALLYEDISPDPRLVGDRLFALTKLLQSEPSTHSAPIVFVASAAAALQRCLPPSALRDAFVTLTVGESVDRDALLLRLIELGYQREEMVETPGQVSVRGGVIDIFPADASSPVRLELFGDEIESLRRFDPGTQRSIEPVTNISVLPAREVGLTEETAARARPLIQQALEKQTDALRSLGKGLEAARLQERIAEVIQALDQRAHVRGLEYFLPFLHPQPATLLDYLPADALVIVDEPGRLAERYQAFQREFSELQTARLEQGLLLPIPESLHLSLEEAQPILDRHRVVEFTLFGAAPDRTPKLRVDIGARPVEEFAGDIPRLAQQLQRWQQQGARVLIATRQVDRLIELLDEAGLGDMVREQPDAAPRPGQLVFSERPLNEGFSLPGAGLAALTDRELFGWRRLRRPLRRRAAEGVPLGSLTDLAPDDYVVHINHGVGIYRGLVRRGPEDQQREYLLVEYAERDRLYVPTEQFDRVQKYLGGEEERPQIHRLGGSEWERTKRRARRSARELAGELVRLYAARQRQPGHPFPPDTPWQREMEDGFLYEETPDQLTSIEAVKQDMQAPQPMDRLLCGDVGYGKTEVAVRAAFKSVMDGKQVAVLVPTTVLAQQHYTTFRERLTPYPVRVEMLSRFRTPKDQARVVADLEAGAVDIVIGTHRLLSNDIRFKDLGLVVIDEEQRFGVRHKEKLKQLRTTVDVLTMTATPIPRTLHMALSGIRDMSVINDPPEGRTSIITRTLPREDGIIRESILRELERGGQVYVVHNRVESIAHIAHHIQRLVPHARVVVAHGQMNERQLERAMLEFYAGEAHILVSTTIIENGLDIPNVNTMIVTDSDRLGLAQLYQLRGRVGRSNRQAYAYLMWTPYKQLTEAAEKRIAAIREFSELGSGFKIALRDLEIRGAGNLLGPEQHGFISSVGFDLYMQMLADAVQEAKGETPAARPQVSVDLPVQAYLPEDYAPDLNQRIELYRRLAAAPDHSHLDQLAEEIADRFGRPLSQPVEDLVRLARLKVRCASAGVQSITTDGYLASLLLTEGRRLPPPLANRLRMALPPKTRIWLALINHDRVVVSLRKADSEGLFSRLEQTLEALASLPLEEEARRHQRRLGLLDGRKKLAQRTSAARSGRPPLS